MVKLEEISSEMLSGLSSLQLLSIGYTAATHGDCRSLFKGLEGLKCMEELFICLRSPVSMQTLLDSHKLHPCVRKLSLQMGYQGMDSLHLFPYLETLEIDGYSYLQNEKLVLENKAFPSKFPRHQSWYNLGDVRIAHCGELLDLTWLVNAPNLRRLEVGNCVSMEEVMGEVSEIEQDLCLFSRLAYLCLSKLPKLRSICEWSLPFPSLEELIVCKCPSLKKLPFDSSIGSSKNLEKIRGEPEWWDALEWEDQTVKHILTPYLTSR